MIVFGKTAKSLSVLKEYTCTPSINFLKNISTKLILEYESTTKASFTSVTQFQ